MNETTPKTARSKKPWQIDLTGDSSERETEKPKSPDDERRPSSDNEHAGDRPNDRSFTRTTKTHRKRTANTHIHHKSDAKKRATAKKATLAVGVRGARGGGGGDLKSHSPVGGGRGRRPGCGARGAAWGGGARRSARNVYKARPTKHGDQTCPTESNMATQHGRPSQRSQRRLATRVRNAVAPRKTRRRPFWFCFTFRFVYRAFEMGFVLFFCFGLTPFIYWFVEISFDVDLWYNFDEFTVIVFMKLMWLFW